MKHDQIWRRLLLRDAGLLDDALVDGNFATHERGEFLRCHRQGADAELAELRDHIGILHAACDLRVECLPACW